MTSETSSITPIPNFYRASAADFKKIPGSPIAYNTSSKTRQSFAHAKPLAEIAKPLKGFDTGGDGDRFFRYWYEVSENKIFRSGRNQDDTPWVECNKGGSFRKWYGNRENIVLFGKNGVTLYSKKGANIRNKKYYFQPGLTYSVISSSAVSFRYSFPESIFYQHGATCFPLEKQTIYCLLGVMNSSVANHLLGIICPTLSYTVDDVAKMPILEANNNEVIVKKALFITRSDWDSYETSWDFTIFPLLQPKYHQPTLREAYTKLRAHWKGMTLEMQRLEEENNRIFIEAYGLQDELTPEVPLSEITLTCNPYYRYNGDRSEEELEALLLTDTIKEFISYAVGCIFGRYSLDKPGLVLANQGEKIGDYLEQVPEPSFMPDADNIIPILEDEYFEDDIVSRFKEFLKVTFGEDTLSENLDFIAEALGGNGKKSSEAVIRDYFLKSFYKDHVKMYKKRPIYWLFSSGKGRAFNALIYMHRYNKETLALMRTDYLLELEGKLDAKREMIKSDIGKDAQEKARLGKMIEEIMAYDEVLKNKADAYIEIDLDDGVKVNYARFEGLVEKI